MLALLVALGGGCQKKIPNEGPYQVPASQMFLFPDLDGPSGVSVVPERPKTTWKTYSQGSTSRLAILLTDEKSPWLGVTHALKSFGVPFVVTCDYKVALKHRVVLVYPFISGLVCKPDELRALAAFPEGGGTLIACNVLGGGLGPTFGFDKVVSGAHHGEIRFASGQTLTKTYTDPREKVIRLEKTHGSNSYSSPLEKPLATFEDGSAAITQHQVGAGHTYAFGFDLGQYFLTGYNARQETMARSFDNAYEPSVDVLVRLVRAMYLQGEPRAAIIDPVPNGKELTVVMSHDIDFTESIENAVDYAKWEQENKVPATHFIQTKYIRDYNDDIFFNELGVDCLRQVDKLGGEIGSHTIAHSKIFHDFPMGSGKEHYPTYAPFVKEAFVAFNGSILGELRVSKFLLESQIEGHTVTSFRPGELSYPFRLPEALMATGFKASSSTTANNCLTHLPFQLTYSRETDAEVPMFEFPVTIEDEAEPKMGDRVQPAVDLAGKLRRYGGLMVILIHPNILDHKLKFEQEFIAAVRPFSWLTDLHDFAEWWMARNEVTVDVSDAGGAAKMMIQAPREIEGLTVVPPRGWKLKKSVAGVSESPRGLLFKKLKGKVELAF